MPPVALGSWRPALPPALELLEAKCFASGGGFWATLSGGKSINLTGSSESGSIRSGWFTLLCQ